MRARTNWLIALAALVGTFLCACSDYHPVKYRYEVQKRLQYAEKLRNDAELKNELTTPVVAVTIETAYGEVLLYAHAVLDSIDRVQNASEWEDISRLSFQAGTRLSQMLFSERKFDSCLTILRTLSSRISLPLLESASLKVNIAQVLQAAGKWTEAVATYSEAIAMLNPPVDPAGQVIHSVFDLPSHIYRIERQTSDSITAVNSLRQAFSYYHNFVNSRTNPNLALAAHGMLAGLYADTRDWRACVSELSQMKDSNGIIGLDAQVRIADIRAGELLEFDSALAMYDRIGSRLIGQDTALRPILLFKRSLVFMEMNRYDDARRILMELDRKYHRYFVASPAAQQVKARSFELDSNWDRAETEYRFLIENHAGTEEAMQAYLYLGEQFAKRGRTTEADRWMQKAEAYYQQTAERSVGSPMEARALTYKAEMFRRRSDWAGAATVLTTIFAKFPESEIGRNAALVAVGLYREKLSRPDIADSLVTALRSGFITAEPATR